MEDQALRKAVQGFYSQEIQDGSYISNYKGEQLTPQQRQAFELLSDDSKKRLKGAGLHVPEDLQGKRVLDVGCAFGSLVFLMSKLTGPTGHVVGIDITEALIEKAKSLSEYHWKRWGYDKPNFEFHVLGAEDMEGAGFQPEEFDIIVCDRVLCLVSDKEQVFKSIHRLLKTGGQFILNDIYAEKSVPTHLMENQHLWVMGATGSMPWKTLAPVVGSAGFSAPHLTSVVPLGIATEECRELLEYNRYTSAGWRLFKVEETAVAKEASLVIYNGGIEGFPNCFPWDVHLTFKKGVGVEVDGQLATLLSSCYLAPAFSFHPATGHPATHRNQNPFQFLDSLKAEGRLPEVLYMIQ